MGWTSCHPGWKDRRNNSPMSRDSETWHYRGQQRHTNAAFQSVGPRGRGSGAAPPRRSGNHEGFIPYCHDPSPSRIRTVQVRETSQRRKKYCQNHQTGRAELVLHGHSHNESLVTVPETEIPLLGVSSTSMHSSKPWRRASWNRLDISKKEGFWSLGITQRLLADNHIMEDGFTRHLNLPMKSK